MRGKVCPPSCLPREDGITPAYAGKRIKHYGMRTCKRDHPRVCGEKLPLLVCWCALYGSPPHMRGKVVELFPLLLHHGITPAYAGKRRSAMRPSSVAQDHPRICGEKMWSRKNKLDFYGSPPHMRGKVVAHGRLLFDVGITPAYAGKSGTSEMSTSAPLGSPPHMRGKAETRTWTIRQSRITPAYAGKSPLFL